MELAFCDRSLTEEADRDALLSSHPISEREADRYRETAGDDRVAAEESASRVEEMHRPASPVAAPFLLAVHLGHERVRTKATGNRVAVFSIGRNDVVVGVEC